MAADLPPPKLLPYAPADSPAYVLRGFPRLEPSVHGKLVAMHVLHFAAAQPYSKPRGYNPSVALKEIRSLLTLKAASNKYVLGLADVGTPVWYSARHRTLHVLSDHCPISLMECHPNSVVLQVLILQVLSGLNHIHNVLRTALRTLSPSTILVRNSEGSRAHWVISGLCGSVPTAGDRHFAFLAPEVKSGILGEVFPPRADMWSLGEILRCLTRPSVLPPMTSDRSRYSVPEHEWEAYCQVVSLSQKFRKERPQERMSVRDAREFIIEHIWNTKLINSAILR